MLNHLVICTTNNSNEQHIQVRYLRGPQLGYHQVRQLNISSEFRLL